MGLLGSLAKLVGGAALESVIDTACDQFEQFVKGIGVGKSHTWAYTFKVKGKTVGSINVKVSKSRNNISFRAAGQDFKIKLSGVSEACKIAVHAAIAAA